MNKLEAEVEKLVHCLECEDGGKFKEQIQQIIAGSLASITKEFEKLPNSEPNNNQISYHRGQINAAKNILTLSERALSQLQSLQKAKNIQATSQKKHKEKLQGRL
jgi:hypothetical protein